MKTLKEFLNEAYKVKANRKLGKTKSGKIIYSNLQPDKDEFNLEELKDALDIVGTEIERLNKLRRNSGNVYKQLVWLADSYRFTISKLDGSFNKKKPKEKDHWLSRRDITDNMRPDTNFN